MTATSYAISTSEDIAVKQWSELLHQDVIMGEPLINDMRQDGVLVIEDGLTKAAGDKVTKNYSTRLTQKGVLGSGPKRSAAKNVTYVTDSIIVDELTITVRAKTKGSIVQQRVAFDLDDSSYYEAANWFKQRVIGGAFNQAGGFLATSFTFDGETYTGDNRKQMTGLQLPTAPTTYRAKYATGSSDANVQADSTATLTLAAIDACVTEARTQRAGVNNFKPLIGKRYNGMPYNYVFYVSVSGMTQLIQDATGVSYGNIILNQLAGGKDDAAAMAGRAFVYRDTKVVEVPDHYIPNGLDSGTVQANVKRALFCGAEAACLAFGKGYESMKGETVPGFTLVNDYDKIEKEVYTSATGIFGIKKAVVNSYDQSVITYSHYYA